MSAMLELLMAAPWTVRSDAERHDVIALATDGSSAGFVALDVPQEVAEHIVDAHNRELQRREKAAGCDLCSPDNPGHVYVSSLNAWAEAACGHG